MMVFKILMTLFVITKAQQSILQQKLVYQMDISEHCKRLVQPSIFLTKNSVDTSAFIMHFSQKELPYSCPISVRTEPGNNIIMVIKIFPLEGMKKRCEMNAPEFLVHEMGETFGGYWGPLGKSIFRQQSVKPKIYTLKTTKKIPAKINVTSPRSVKTTETTKPTQKILEDSGDEDFISVDVPLVNVSGKLLFVDKNNDTGSDEDDDDAMFDLKYNVTPEPGVDYATSVIPIVQFSLKSHPGWRKEGDDGEPRFDLDIIEKYTPDHRLTIPFFQSTKRLKFRKLSPRTTIKRRHQYFRKNSTKGKLQTLRFMTHKYTGYDFPTTKASKSLQNDSRLYSWNIIEELINKANLTASLRKGGDKNLSDEKDKILHNISDMKHNFSIYLKPNLSLYDSPESSAFTTTKINTLSMAKFNKTHTIYAIKAKSLNQVTSKLTELINQTSTSVSHSPLEKLDNVPSEITENYYFKGQTTSSIGEVISNNVSKGTDNKTKSIQMPDKSLVDRESWENVVQAAPDMAVLLNITKDEIKIPNVVTNNKIAHIKSLGLRRKKREIQAVDISNVSPHNMTTKSSITSTLKSSFGVADMQEFSQLVELKDDELYGRVALKFLRQYVGRVIYNVCNFNTTETQQQVQLFHTSRIVLAINNFTNLAGITLVLTSARALVAGEVDCPGTNIECQVSGSRVCIDATSACDGVPNCGSYDVYDEDRLMCGASEGLQHNVYIAAFTFLAVLLTLLYSVHYWLRRCVPKVADAFFIYTNGTENILYLEPKMRSPHDYGDHTSKLFFHPSMLDVDVELMTETIKPNCWKTFIRYLCCGLTIRKSATENPPSNTEGENAFINFNPKVKYSFTQLQLQNITGKTKTSVQSENGGLKNISDSKIEKHASPPTIPQLKSNDSILTLEEPLPEDYKDELGMIRFLKKNRLSVSSTSNEVLLGTVDTFSVGLDKNSVEMETKNIEYDRHQLAEPGPSGVNTKDTTKQLSEPGPSDLQTTKQVVKKTTSKRLRFDNNTTMIPASIAEMDEDEEEIDEHSRPRKHSTFLDTVMGKQKFFGGVDDDNEYSMSKEHKRFWGGSGKAKKPTRTKNSH